MQGPSRDLIGYAGDPPVADWPNQARVAVNFCVNYEEGAEYCLLNGDDRHETLLRNPFFIFSLKALLVNLMRLALIFR